ncbi:DUF1186 domain-containing protein [Paenibacillus oceani]|uniref:DUF1186 domain-containing protein n=1 Tax=Paenibacillus oceani TaxID=2772510 RepID=A0A927C9F0_9BACL|nr:DUF1186 domain-containing protein [Paenibacillus oceani]MBD2862447.1 DUF1186 domain-containing protein [Paenibacillus oceani]
MEHLIQNIRYNEGAFPREELQQIIERKEEAIPHLLQIMNDLNEDYEKVIERPERIDFIYAFYLLAQFREQALFPILIEILSKPAGICEEIFDDSITEGVGQALASTYNGEIELLQRLIENTEANEYARGQALVALVILVLDGQLSREFVMDYFKQLINDKQKRSEDSYYLNTEIVCCCNDLYPEEVAADIQRLYEDRIVETMIIGMDDVRGTLKRTKEAVLRESGQYDKYRLITDTIEELQGWACFQPDADSENAYSELESYFGAEPSAFYEKPRMNPAVKVEKIGRNDPCTCGSGKKYKKCCGA